MSSLKFVVVPINSGYTYSNIDERLLGDYGVHLAHQSQIALLSPAIKKLIRRLEGGVLVRPEEMLLSHIMPESKRMYLAYIDKEHPTNPERVLTSSYTKLKPGDHCLCYETNYCAELQGMFGDEPASPYDYWYRCHFDPDRLPKMTNHQAYVNVNRDSESIGGSSWCGNMVRWFEAGFTTRIQYGIAAGLFPEE